MRKRKTLIMFIASMSLAIGAVATVLSVNKHGSIFNSKGPNNEFVLDNTTVQKTGEVEDIYKAVMVSSTASINVKLSGVIEDEHENLIVEHGACAVISNLTDSPIRGIEDLSLQLNVGNNGAQVYFCFYLSYNPLNLADIFDGKYQDLKTMIYNQNFYGVQTLSTQQAGMDLLAYRYFLTTMWCFDADITLQSMSVSTPCDTPPTEVPVGEFRNNYSASELELIPNDTPFIGNGSYYLYSSYGYVFSQFFQPQGKLQQFLSDFETAGYDMVNDSMSGMEGILIYQKYVDDGQYETFAVSGIPTMVGEYEFFSFEYAGLQQSMALYTSWPQEQIEGFLTDDTFKAMISDPNLPEGCGYTLLETGGTVNGSIVRGVSVQITFELNLTNARAVDTALRALIAKFETQYHFISSSGDTSSSSGSEVTNLNDYYYYNYSRTSPNISYRVETSLTMYAEYDYVMCRIAFSEYEFGSFPHDSLENRFGEGYFDDIVSANAKYRTTSSSSPSNYASYYAKDLTEEEVGTYFDSLLDKGWVLVEKANYSEIYLEDTSNVVPEKRLVRFTNRGGYYLIEFKKETMNSTESFLMALNRFAINWQVINNLNDAINDASEGKGLEGTFYFPEESSDHGTIYWENYSQEDFNLLKNVLTYKESINRYVFAIGRYAVLFTFEEQGDYVIMNLETSYYYDLDIQIVENQINRSQINEFVASMMAEQEVTDDYSLYEFDSDEVAYYGDGSYVYLVGNKDDIDAVMNAYIAKVRNSEHVDYSEYLDKYINKVNGVEVDEDSYFESGHGFGDVSILRINYSFGNVFTDYKKYSEITIAEFLYLDEYPSLAVDDNPHFVVQEDSQSFLRITVNDSFVPLYQQALLNGGFVLARVEEDEKQGIANYFYQKVNSNGDLIEASFMHGCLYLSISTNRYQTLDEIKAIYAEDETVTAFLNSAVLPNDNSKNFNLTVNEPLYSLEYFTLNYDSFKVLLLTAGYEEPEENSNRFYNLVGNDVHGVYIRESEKHIYYQSTNVTPVSNDDFVATAVASGFDSRRLNHFVDFDSFDGTLSFQGAQGDGKGLSGVIVDPDFDLEAYQTKLVEYGYEYNPSGTYSYDNDKTHFSISRVYEGVYQFTYFDYHIFYSSFASVRETILEGMPESRFNLFVSPDDEGDIFYLSAHDSNSFTIIYDEGFDLDGYLTKVGNAEYNIEGGKYYYCSKGGSEIRIYPNENEISFYDSSTIRTQFTDEFLEDVLKENGFELSNECDLPSITYDIYYSSYECYFWDYDFQLVFYVDGEIGESRETSSNGNIYIETYFSGEGYAWIYVVDFAKNSDTFRNILKVFGITDDSENKFVDTNEVLSALYSCANDGSEILIRTSDNNSTFVLLAAFIKENPGFFTVLTEVEGLYISFVYDGYIYYLYNSASENLIFFLTQNEPYSGGSEELEDPEPVPEEPEEPQEPSSLLKY